jgi:hypothetical protein
MTLSKLLNMIKYTEGNERATEQYAQAMAKNFCLCLGASSPLPLLLLLLLLILLIAIRKRKLSLQCCFPLRQLSGHDSDDDKKIN